MRTIKSFVIVCMLMVILAGCGNRPDNIIVIAGSTSVLPYAEILAEEYEKLNGNIEIDVQGGGSSAGIEAVKSYTADIGMSSRELKAEEIYWTTEIAKDGLAIIVHPDNPVSDLSLAEITDIYARNITNWQQLGGKDAKIHVIAREDGSGTRTAFEDLVMQGKYEITPKAIIQDSNGAVRQLVCDDPNAIGFISLGLVDNTVKALLLDGIEASRVNVINGSYTLYRGFLFVCLSQPDDFVKGFIDFVLSQEGQAILVEEGLIPE